MTGPNDFVDTFATSGKRAMSGNETNRGTRP